jgi:hypothetical protein
LQYRNIADLCSTIILQPRSPFDVIYVIGDGMLAGRVGFTVEACSVFVARQKTL